VANTLDQQSKAPPETFRASTRTVLFDQAKASGSMKRVEEASDASVRSALAGAGHCHIEQVDGTRRERRQAEGDLRGEFPLADRERRRTAEQSRAGAASGSP
jgi:hypothetical protein